ncbi:DUF1120 domain-containing protein [Ewingella americana]|uniref:DUF1120 domain-containing protein n=1 Tax=Ewingella americana TaxID=41202 RepID=UPI0012AD99B1|nr:DUF1120 domain-containing protein [Ewingella americana]MRT03216.1 DUF1120 domain-containing protein [Ewingella americana]
MENNTMKIIFKVTAMACFITIASNAVAGPSANVSIKGTVKMGACTPTLSSDVLDWGDVDMDSLNISSSTYLGEKKLDLNISCSSPTVLGVTYTDNRSSSLVGLAIPMSLVSFQSNNKPNEFGLGFTKEGKKIGAYAGVLDETKVIVDGNSSDVIYSQNYQDAAPVWTAVSGTTTMQSEIRAHSISSSGTNTPSPFTNAKFTYDLGVSVDSKSNLASNEIITLDGNVTFGLYYL